ncbi:hypothetical protein DPMN_049575 [Dreissena polymorpha]|uniref:glutathione transferase n=2 Tax=Dreissena polymorpha TaxID=45954 RepID=A0A9D4CFM1_DREPO|nr:hypothetical protein DPMN_049575 [Dreissena polymorpha]
MGAFFRSPRKTPSTGSTLRKRTRERFKEAVDFLMTVQLFYFSSRSRAQAIRYLCLDNGIDYEEVDVDQEWTTKYKPMMPFGQVPVIEDGGVKVAQSCAILRYLAKKAGLNVHENPVVAARTDMINDQVEDIRGAYIRMIYEHEGSEKDFLKTAKVKVEYIETLMSNWGSDYILDKISYADYNLFDMLDVLSLMSPGFWDDVPTLKAFHDRIAARPALKAYRDTDAFKLLPQNG